jgi:hypothetical protein
MKKIIVIFAIAIASTALTAGIVRAAATHNITGTLGGVAGDTFSLEGTLAVGSLHVGSQGTGGVTYFNGTIINNTTGTGGANNPVTFGDNIRIDGRIYRGATAGPTDSLPFIINDNAQVDGGLTVSGAIIAGGKDVPTKTVMSGSLNKARNGDKTSVMNFGSDCNSFPEGPENYTYHYRAISIPGLSPNNPMDVRVFTSVDDTTGDLAGPNMWASAGYYMSTGSVYVLYKSVVHGCDGSNTTSYYSTGNYKVVVLD